MRRSELVWRWRQSDLSKVSNMPKGCKLPVNSECCFVLQAMTHHAATAPCRGPFGNGGASSGGVLWKSRRRERKRNLWHSVNVRPGRLCPGSPASQRLLACCMLLHHQAMSGIGSEHSVHAPLHRCRPWKRSGHGLLGTRRPGRGHDWEIPGMEVTFVHRPEGTRQTPKTAVVRP